jgi:hypothetical protein
MMPPLDAFDSGTLAQIERMAPQLSHHAIETQISILVLAAVKALELIPVEDRHRILDETYREVFEHR